MSKKNELESSNNLELPKGALMSYDAAEAELEAWFNYRKLRHDKRAEDQDSDFYYFRDQLIKCFMYGQLSFDNEKGTLYQKLDFPLESDKGEIVLTEIVYKPRFSQKLVENNKKGFKSTDSEAHFLSLIAASTGKDARKILSLDTVDYTVAKSISIFLA